jgi:SAM-dependent methyltransferase
MNGESRSRINIACPDDLAALQGAVTGFECSLCGRHFPSVDGIVQLLPREALQQTSPENSQLNAYCASFSNRPESAWRHSLGGLLGLLGNSYLYSWAFRTLEKLASGQSFAVLDAACGDGILRRYLPSRHAYVGIDFSTRLLLRAQRYRSATYFQADLNHLPFPSAAFDAVLSLQALQYLDRPQTALAEMARVLKTGGKLLLTVPNDESFKYRRQGIPKIQLQRFNRQSLPALLAAKFEVLQATTRGFWLPVPRISVHAPGVYPPRWGLSWTVVATPKK